ncbi:MAG: ComEC/Rec2 family competence protein [Microgenomates group bacterium]
MGSVLLLQGSAIEQDGTQTASTDNSFLIKKRLNIESIQHFSPSLSSVKDWKYVIYSNSIKSRSWLFELFKSALEEPYLSLAWQLTFGKIPTGKSFADPVISAIGMQHISSVSGLHFGIIFGVLDAQLSHRRSKEAMMCLIFILFLYCLLSGWSIPALRAFLMLIIFLFSAWCKRQYHSKSALLYATWFMLCVDPMLLGSVSLHLSFLGTAGVLFLYPIFSRETRKKGGFFHSLGRGKGALFVESFLVSVAAQIAVFPLLLVHFQEFHHLSSFTGIVLSILMPFIMILSLATTAALLFTCFFHTPAWVLFAIGQPISILSHLFLWFAQIFAIVKNTTIQSDKFTLLYTVLYLLMVGICIQIYELRRRKKRKFQSAFI